MHQQTFHLPRVLQRDHSPIEGGVEDLNINRFKYSFSALTLKTSSPQSNWTINLQAVQWRV